MFIIFVKMAFYGVYEIAFIFMKLKFFVKNRLY